MRLWDVQSAEPIEPPLVGHTQGVDCIGFSPDGASLASASGDRTARVWDLMRRQVRLTLPGHSHFVTAVSFSPDNLRLALARNDRSIKIWDAAQRRDPRSFASGLPNVETARVTPDGRKLVVRGAGGRAQACTLDDDGHWSEPTPTERELLSNAPSSELSPPLQSAADSIRAAHPGQAALIVASPDSQRLASASTDGTIRIWHPATGQELLTLKAHLQPVAHLIFSPDGGRLISIDSAGTVKIWDARP